ncbi:MAG: RNA pseudouridine synthase [Balneolaceae bacterium]|nr:RNA pseudouridine synthase [Balneolaceae bacterium]
MQNQRKKFKPAPKRFHPRGINVIYEDYDILVIEKIHGLLTVANAKESENTVVALLTDYVKKGNSKSKNELFIVHRLDRDTSGIMVFAKSNSVKEYLQHHWKKSKKTYYTVVHGILNEKEGVISSYLTENKIHRVYSTKDREVGKLAKTEYKVIKESEKYSLVEINLLTGRKNQIRVHFSERGNPVVGDKMYGGKEKGIKRLTLHAASLRIKHPVTNEVMTFETEIPEYFQKLVS